MSTEKIVAYIEKQQYVHVPVSEVARALGYPRQYVHEVCKKRGFLTCRPRRLPIRLCLGCRKVSKHNWHRACWDASRRGVKPNQVTFSCAYPPCSKQVTRYVRKDAQLHFCSRVCRDAGQREGYWPGRVDNLAPTGTR